MLEVGEMLVLLVADDLRELLGLAGQLVFL